MERRNLVEIYGVESDMFRDRDGTKMRKQNILVESFHLKAPTKDQLVALSLLHFCQNYIKFKLVKC